MRGGEIVAEGTPEDVAASARSYTGQHLKPLLEAQAPAVREAAVKKGRKKVAA